MTKENYLSQGDRVDIIDDPESGNLAADIWINGVKGRGYRKIWIGKDPETGLKTGGVEAEVLDGVQTATLVQHADGVTLYDQDEFKFLRKIRFIVTDVRTEQHAGKFVGSVKPGPKPTDKFMPLAAAPIDPAANPPPVSSLIQLTRHLGGGLEFLPPPSLASGHKLLENVEINNQGALISLESFHSQEKFVEYLKLGRLNQARICLIHETFNGRWRYILACQLQEWKALDGDEYSLVYEVQGVIAAQAVQATPSGKLSKGAVKIIDQHPEKMLEYGKEPKVGMENDLHKPSIPNGLMAKTLYPISGIVGYEEAKQKKQAKAELLLEIKKADYLQQKKQKEYEAKLAAILEKEDVAALVEEEAKKKAAKMEQEKIKAAIKHADKLSLSTIKKLLGLGKDDPEPGDEDQKPAPAPPRGRKVILD